MFVYVSLQRVAGNDDDDLAISKILALQGVVVVVVEEEGKQ